MLPARLKTLENSANAARSAFGFDEADFETRFVAPVRPGRFVVFGLALFGAAAALAHQMGWAQIISSFGGWRASI
jgi:hypothetical protein